MNETEQKTIEAAARTGYAAEEAEKALIGDIILKYDNCAHVVSELSDEDFYFDAYRIYEC